MTARGARRLTQVRRGMRLPPTTPMLQESQAISFSLTRASDMGLSEAESSVLSTAARTGSRSKGPGLSIDSVRVKVLGFDGDDTLWHSEAHVEGTQGEFGARA